MWAGGGAYPAARNFRIIGNYFSSNLASPDTGAGFGVGVAGPGDGVISGNTFHNIRWQAIRCESGTSPLQIQGPRGWVIDGNQIDGAGAGFATQNFGIYMLVAQDVVISNNVVRGVRDAGIVLIYLSETQLVSKVNVIGNIVDGATIGEGYKLWLPPGPASDAAVKSTANLNVIGNGAYNGAGTGFEIVGHGGPPNGLNFGFNIARGNAGAGVQCLNVAPTLFSNVTNDTSDNTGGDMTFNTAGTPPILVQGGKKLITQAVAAGGSGAYANVINLGKGARGQLTVRSFDVAVALTNWCTKLYEITWDGTTLTQSTIATSASGVTVSDNSLQMAGAVLQARASNAPGASITAALDCQFVGSIIRNA
jgi:hypothetical protein